MASLFSLMQSVALFVVVLVAVDGFVERPSGLVLMQLSIRQNDIHSINDKFQKISPLFLSDHDDDDDDDNNNNNNGSSLNKEDRLRQLGYRDDEIRRSQSSSSRNDEIKVRVDLVDDIDPVTLTAIGFALIALNFLVLANLGDGGISGVVATIINSF
jgi:hypothetical protein